MKLRSSGNSPSWDLGGTCGQDKAPFGSPWLRDAPEEFCSRAQRLLLVSRRVRKAFVGTDVTAGWDAMKTSVSCRTKAALL